MMKNKRPIKGANQSAGQMSGKPPVMRSSRKTRKFKVWLYSLAGLILVISLVLYYLPLIRTRDTKINLLQHQVTPELIARGEYLANHVTICMDCHGERDWTRYSGPPVQGTAGTGGEIFNQQMGFPGVFYAKNITPGHLGNWTDDQLLRAFTTGVKPDGEVLFPVMPYPYYRHLDPTDAAAIIAYIRTLKPSNKQTPERSIDFPMNLLLRLIPKPADFKPMPPKTDQVAYGGYLTTIAGCAECHTPANHGQIDQSRLFAGGRLFKMPGGDLYSSNITPDSIEGIGRWTADNFVAKFKFFADSSHLGHIGPGAQNTIMPWSMYSGMDSTDLAAIYAYLRSLPAKKSTAMLAER